jgi:hypothetical protein
MTRRTARSVLAGRGFVLFPAAAYAVHQLRFEIGYGSGSGAALAAQGHGYLDSLAPWLGLLLALGLGAFLTRLVRAAAGRPDLRPGRSVAALAGVAAGLLLLAYVAQEWLEGVFAAGHPAGFAGVFGHGGWWAVPLSALAGVAVAALLRLASAAIEAVSRVCAPPARAGSRPILRPVSVSALRLSPLARRLAGRAPPGACVTA